MARKEKSIAPPQHENKSPILLEIRSSMERMKNDINTQPLFNPSHLNRFTEKIHSAALLIVERLSKEEVETSGNVALDIWNEGATLGEVRFSDMIFAYKKITKKRELPESPTELQNALVNSPEWILRQFNLDLEIVNATFNTIKKEAEISKTGLSSFWIFGQILDIAQTGLRLKSKSDSERYYKRLEEILSEKGIKSEDRRGTGAAFLILCATEAYIHPATLKSMMRDYDNYRKFAREKGYRSHEKSNHGS